MQTFSAENTAYLEPVLAYDQLASSFGDISAPRRPYLAAIEALVIANLPQASRSLLDIGSGDGVRAIRIAAAAHIKRLVLLEPSSEMRKQWPSGTRGLAMRAEELDQISESFDIITCLWNVLGHIFPATNRVNVLSHCARLLSVGGRIFVDLNHRYNALHYGLLPTALRYLQDFVKPGEKNGDVRVQWNVHGASLTTNGHVFTHREFQRLVGAAGLIIDKRFTVDYRTGFVRRSQFTGNLLYMLRRMA